MDLNKINEVEDYFVFNINETKEKVLRELIEKIEGRPAELSDAKNITLGSYPSEFYRQMVIYKDVHIGYLEMDMGNMSINFIPC
jgi:hypothetical protein